MTTFHSPDSSSTGSFRTAPPSPESMDSEDTWPGIRQKKPPDAIKYRPAQQLPRELRVQCGIYLNERLYSAGLTLLTNLLSAGGSNSNSSTIPSFIPTPLQIGFITTLTVHPFNTMNILPDDNHEVASAAITLLRLILSTVGPINSHFSDALNFTSRRSGGNKSRSRTRYHLKYESDDETSSGESEEDERATMNNTLAGKESLRYRAVDFWHAVGWAMNCSVRYPERWRYWKVWLGFMLDVLDRDWEEREREDEEAFRVKEEGVGEQDVGMEYRSRQGSILVKYLAEIRGRQAGIRRVIKSVFADGCHDSLRAFPAVFDSEVRSLQRKRKREFKEEEEEEQKVFVQQKLNLEDDEDDMFVSSSQQMGIEEIEEDLSDEEMERLAVLGGVESIHLRQRLLGILSRLAVTLPDTFDSGKEIYKIYVDHLRLLPLPAFALFISPSSHYSFIPEVLCSLDQMLLVRLLPSTAPRGRRSANDEISQELLEQRFLPYCANSNNADDHVRFSVLVESLLRLFLVTVCELDYSPALVRAVEEGIKAREAKLVGKVDRRRKGSVISGGLESPEGILLRASSARLREILKWAEEDMKGKGKGKGRARGRGRA